MMFLEDVKRYRRQMYRQENHDFYFWKIMNLLDGCTYDVIDKIMHYITTNDYAIDNDNGNGYVKDCRISDLQLQNNLVFLIKNRYTTVVEWIIKNRFYVAVNTSFEGGIKITKRFTVNSNYETFNSLKLHQRFLIYSISDTPELLKCDKSSQVWFWIFFDYYHPVEKWSSKSRSSGTLKIKTIKTSKIAIVKKVVKAGDGAVAAIKEVVVVVYKREYFGVPSGEKARRAEERKKFERKKKDVYTLSSSALLYLNAYTYIVECMLRYFPRELCNIIRVYLVFWEMLHTDKYRTANKQTLL